jgi:hypothetical protein
MRRCADLVTWRPVECRAEELSIGLPKGKERALLGAAACLRIPCCLTGNQFEFHGKRCFLSSLLAPVIAKSNSFHLHPACLIIPRETSRCLATRLFSKRIAFSPLPGRAGEKPSKKRANRQSAHSLKVDVNLSQDRRTQAVFSSG